MMEILSEVENGQRVKNYEKIMVELVTVYHKETGVEIDKIMDMGPTQLFAFSQTITRLYEENKNNAEFERRLNSKGTFLG
jgi:hypothetical protein